MNEKISTDCFNQLFLLQTHCSVNYDNWPWSEQNCTYTAGSWTHDIENINIQPSLDDISKEENPLNFDLFNKNRVSFTKSLKPRPCMFFRSIRPPAFRVFKQSKYTARQCCILIGQKFGKPVLQCS